MSLVDKAMLDNIEFFLLDLPEKIAEAKRTCNCTRQVLQDTAEELKALESKIRADIAEAEDASGKPLFSNEAKREAEFQRQIVNTGRHRVLKAEIAALRSQLDDQEIELALLADRFSAYKHLARLAAAMCEAAG